ncbi:MAG TPA: AAA family ATPase, partial [Usitatibacter sp.]
EELRLNRRTAPGLYLGVVAIAGTLDKPVVEGEGPVLDYAVRMRRFAQDDLLDHRAFAGRLPPEMVDLLAAKIARFHGDAARARVETDFGSAPLVLSAALDNLATIERIDHDGVLGAVAELRRWTGEKHAALLPAFAERKLRGFVRECHGDLHLGNIVVVDGVPTPFDCIEFDSRLRHIDVMSDVAFTSMDFIRLGYPHLAARFVNAYLEHTGDYAGLRVLRYYSVYRAMVRAKVCCIRAHQVDLEDHKRPAALDEMRRDIDLARKLSQPGRLGLVLMHGVSGSGKTTLSAELLEAFGAVRIRSDIERKRLHGLEPLARSGSAPGGGIYGSADTEGTYGRLLALAREALADGYPVIVDATFLRRAQRDAFRALADALGVPFAIVSCEAPEARLRDRLDLRDRSRTDPS